VGARFSLINNGYTVQGCDARNDAKRIERRAHKNDFFDTGSCISWHLRCVAITLSTLLMASFQRLVAKPVFNGLKSLPLERFRGFIKKACFLLHFRVKKLDLQSRKKRVLQEYLITYGRKFIARANQR
jgi:hypothetical protein